MLETVTDEYIKAMNSWSFFNKDKSNYGKNSPMYDTCERHAAMYHDEAYTIERMAKLLFGDVNLFDMWLASNN